MLIIEGYQQRVIEQYKQTRLVMYTMVRLMGDPKKSPDSPEALWRLPGEEVNNISEEEIAAIFAKLRDKEANG